MIFSQSVSARYSAVDCGVNFSERRDTVFFDELFACHRMRSQFFCEAVAYSERKTHYVCLLVAAFNTKGLFEVGFELEDLLIGITFQLEGTGDFPGPHFFIMRDKTSLKVPVVEIFDFIVYADFNYGEFVFPLAP